jgi:MFS family permease
MWIAISARAVSLLGDQAAVLALTLRLVDRGESAATISALLIAGLVPLVVLAPLAGRLIDRHDSRTLLVTAGLAQTVLCLGLIAFSSTAATLVLVAALGAGEAVTGSTWQALLPSIVPPEQLSRAMGYSQAAGTTASVLAVVAGGVLTGQFGPDVPLAVDAVTFGLLALGALLVRVRRVPPREHSDERGGLAIVRRDAVLGVLVALLGVFIVVGGMVNVLEVFLIRETLHAGSAWYGLLGGLYGVGVIAGSLLGGRVSGPRRLGQLVLASAMLLSLGLATYALAPSVSWLVPIALLTGAANGGLNLAVMALVMTRTPESARGRVAATITAVASGGLIAAYLLGGVLATVLTPREVFALAGLASLLAPIAGGPPLRRALRAQHERELAAAEPG